MRACAGCVLGFDPADRERRSERFWAGMARLHARGLPTPLRAAEPGQSPDGRVAA